MPASRAIRRAARARLLVAVFAAACTSLSLSACFGREPVLEGSLNDAQIAGLNTAWTQRITALTAPSTTATQEATKLYKSCAQMDLTVPLLQVVKLACAPTAVSVKLWVLFPERCGSPTGQCLRLLDRAKVANDNQIVTLGQLSDAIRPVTDKEACRAEFETDATRLQAYKDLSTALDTMALGVVRKDNDIFKLGARRVADTRALIASKLRPVEQVQRFRQSCGISD